jgi:cation diffusion facilitator CzcD-associated flavoprotein CzcO
MSTLTSTQVDVLIVGAGISGIGAAYHLSARAPGTTYAVLEGRDAIGGTWDLFRYPGIRSDSDMPTFGYDHKPWTHEKSISEARYILDYLRETVTENGIDGHIRFGHRVLRADFSTATGRWTVTARNASDEVVEFSARFLFSGTGYYDYEGGHTPDFAGIEDYRGTVVHPQFWPEDLDYTGKKVVVIGSGATAVTIVPSMLTGAPGAGGRAAHVTMLQRSPGYVLSLPGTDPIAELLNRVLGHDRAYPLIRRKNIQQQRLTYKFCRRFPKLARRLLIADVRRRLPKDFDVDTHFTPAYDPWDQRLCMVPDGDLFTAISGGGASVVTDRIDRFTPNGILLVSGAELEADIIVTATGLNMKPMGGIQLRVDEQPVDLSETTVYKSMMLSGVPNFVFAIGYTNASWTLKVDIVCEHFVRLIQHMDASGQATMVPVMDEPGMARLPLFDLGAGYVRRRIASFPHGGDRGPWTATMAYEQDVARLRHGPVEDPALHFTPKRSAEVAA